MEKEKHDVESGAAVIAHKKKRPLDAVQSDDPAMIIASEVDDEDTEDKTQNLVEEDTLIIPEHTIEQVYAYFIKEKYGDPIPFTGKSLKNIVIAALAGTGGIYAWPPSAVYGKDYSNWMRWSFIISNPTSNILFLIKATDDLIGAFKDEANLPPPFSTFIRANSKSQLLKKYFAIGLGSLVCVVPFAIGVYLYPPPDCELNECISAVVIHATLSNMILHGFSWNIILGPEYWHYRLPFLPIEKFFSSLASCARSNDENLFIENLNKQNAIATKYRNHISKVFTQAAHRIVGLYANNDNAALLALKKDETAFVNMVEVAYGGSYVEPSSEASSPSCLAASRTMLHDFLRKYGIGFAGGGMMITGCMGWIASPIYIGQLMGLEIAESILLGSLPVYSTSVLCAFYGANIFSRIYSYLTTWEGTWRDKFSPEMKMYPKTFAVYLLLNIYISIFAYASGTELIHLVFNDEMWDDIRPNLVAISIPTLQVLSFVPLADLFSVAVRNYVARFGDEDSDDTFAARLLVKITSVNHYLFRINNTDLLTSLLKYSEAQLKTLGIDKAELRKDALDAVACQTEIERLRGAVSAKVSGLADTGGDASAASVLESSIHSPKALRGSKVTSPRLTDSNRSRFFAAPTSYGGVGSASDAQPSSQLG